MDAGKLELIATKQFSQWDEFYKVVDFLNKSLKEKKLMFGLTKSREDNSMTLSIYEI